MITKLQRKTQEWMQLERKTLEQRRMADEFYEMNLMELIEKEYVRRNKEKVFEAVDYMVISVGTSYEPIVLNIRLLKPQRILFLYTEQSVSVLDKIVLHCKLEQAHYEKSRISETNPLEIYREIKKRGYIFCSIFR